MWREIDWSNVARVPVEIHSRDSSSSRGLERKVRRLEQARGDAKGWFYRPTVDHLYELEQKKAVEQSAGYSSMVAPRELPPPRSWPSPPSNWSDSFASVCFDEHSL